MPCPTKIRFQWPALLLRLPGLDPHPASPCTRDGGAAEKVAIHKDQPRRPSNPPKTRCGGGKLHTAAVPRLQHRPEWQLRHRRDIRESPVLITRPWGNPPRQSVTTRGFSKSGKSHAGYCPVAGSMNRSKSFQMLDPFRPAWFRAGGVHPHVAFPPDQAGCNSRPGHPLIAARLQLDGQFLPSRSHDPAFR